MYTHWCKKEFSGQNITKRLYEDETLFKQRYCEDHADFYDELAEREYELAVAKKMLEYAETQDRLHQLALTGNLILL